MTCLRKRYLAELKKSTINNRQLGNKFLDSADRFEIRNSGIKQRNINGVHTLLDMIGVAEPTGISDGFNALIYLGQGDFKNAGISAAGMIPYIGDTAKGARLGAKALKFADKADDVVDVGKAFKKAENAKNIAKNGGKSAWKRMTAKESKKVAENLGYVKTKYLANNGESIYCNKKTKTYISQDVGSANGMGPHNGGVCKME